jgi:hypothetical protein
LGRHLAKPYWATHATINENVEAKSDREARKEGVSRADEHWAVLTAAAGRARVRELRYIRNTAE